MTDFVFELNGVRKSFLSDNKQNVVLDSISFKLLKSEILCLIGPNGCGKTTLFNIISGLDEKFDGQIAKDQFLFNNGKYPGLVFQQYENSLMPWLNCQENILFPLSIKDDLSQTQKNQLLESVIESLGIQYLPLQSYPYQMSGGEKQMACIARAMITNPSLLLLDEPFSSLDYYRKQELYKVLQNIHHLHNTGIILITHNIDEGILLADRVLILSNKPTTVLKEIKVDLERPRNEKDFSKTSFLQVRNEIINCFEEQEASL